MPFFCPTSNIADTSRYTQTSNMEFRHAVRNDPMWGNVVEVTSGEYVMTYAGLSADILVKMDQSIRAGEQLGSVGEVPCELSMEPHLHFDVRSNGEYVDPVSLAK